MKQQTLPENEDGNASPSALNYTCFAKATRLDWPHYRAVFRGKSPRLLPDQAQAYVAAWVAENCLGADYPTLVQDALTDTSLNGLGLVCAALIAIRAEDFAAAASLAERAYAADQHEVFAQRIFMAAREKRSDLHLEIDDWLEDRFCENPFTDVEIIGSKDVYTCCAAWLPAPIGAADDETQDIWQGERAHELRRSILDGDFSYCSRLNCPKIAGQQLPRAKDVSDPVMRNHIDRLVTDDIPPPDRVLFSYDTSCNLSCPSCRSKFISLGRSAAARLDDFYFEHVTKFSDQATRIKITGSGDPFGSSHFRRVLKDLTSKPATAPRLQLQTNGVLFDERAWQELGLEGHVRSVWISIDATTPETYAKLRRDGDFERLMNNLRFLALKRKQDQIGELRLDFVVQHENYKQMPTFAALAKDIGADGVHFLMLRNWGTFSAEAFEKLAVASASHPDHMDFLDVLRDPRLQGPGIDLGNLAPLQKKALSSAAPAVRTAPDPQAKAIVVLGIPRVGSNYVFGCLEMADSIFVTNEVFNPRGAFGLDAKMGQGLTRLGQQLGRRFGSIHDPDLIAYVRENPTDTLRALRHCADELGQAAVILKIFKGHIEQTTLEDHILRDPDVVPVVQRRALLASYISWLKVHEQRIWVNVDVTDIKPKVDMKAYLRWQAETIDWYRSLGAAFQRQGKEPILLNFEDLVRMNPATMIRRFVDDLLPIVETGVTPIKGFRSLFMRQDRTEDLFDRISNGPALRSALRAEGQIETALGRAPMTPPGELTV